MREHHHLKHHGRQQYWNYLKGIGMPMEETIQHLREEFVKVCPCFGETNQFVNTCIQLVFLSCGRNDDFS